MRALLVSTVALAVTASSAAFAQSQPSGGQNAQQSGAQQTSTRSYKAVEDSLKQAGFQNVRTLNAAYLVSAVTKDGEQVTFVVDPPASAAASGASSGQQSTASNQQSGSSGSAQQGGSGNQQMALQSQKQVRDSLTKAGFSNVQILDAAYLASGSTNSGDRITMMINPSADAAATGSTNMPSGSQPAAGSSSSSSK